MFPPSPMVSQWNDIPRNDFCKPECREENITKSCLCTNVYKIPLDTMVDLFVLDTGKLKRSVYLSLNQM